MSPRNTVSPSKNDGYNEHNDTATMLVAPGASDAIIRANLLSDHPANDENFARGWLAGTFDADGTFPKGVDRLHSERACRVLL